MKYYALELDGDELAGLIVTVGVTAMRMKIRYMADPELSTEERDGMADMIGMLHSIQDRLEVLIAQRDSDDIDAEVAEFAKQIDEMLS